MIRAIANSVPKSGTHLLGQVLVGVPGFHTNPTENNLLHYNRQWDIDDLSSFTQRLDELEAGRVIHAHIGRYAESEPLMEQDGLAHFLIVRDLRDVTVSYVHWLLEIDDEHVFVPFYRNELITVDHALDVAIDGLQQVDSVHLPDHDCLPDLMDRVGPFVRWLDHPKTCIVRFEELVESDDTRKACFQRILDHFETCGVRIANQERAFESMANAVKPAASKTFRSGRIGDWQQDFEERHKDRFKSIAGDLLIRLGYAENNDW